MNVGIGMNGLMRDIWYNFVFRYFSPERTRIAKILNYSTDSFQKYFSSCEKVLRKQVPEPKHGYTGTTAQAWTLMGRNIRSKGKQWCNNFVLRFFFFLCRMQQQFALSYPVFQHFFPNCTSKWKFPKQFTQDKAKKSSKSMWWLLS